MDDEQLYYQCRRCFYNTCKKADMKRHLSKKNKCHRLIESYKFKDSEINELSMIPILGNELKSISQLLCNNKSNIHNVDDYILYIDMNNETKCMYCDKVFFRKYEFLHLPGINRCFSFSYNMLFTSEIVNVRMIENK